MAKRNLGTAIPPASKLVHRGNWAVDCKDWRVGTDLDGRHLLTGLSENEARRIAKERTWAYCESCHAVRYAPEGACWKCRVPIAAECPV